MSIAEAVQKIDASLQAKLQLLANADTTLEAQAHDIEQASQQDARASQALSHLEAQRSTKFAALCDARVAALRAKGDASDASNDHENANAAASVLVARAGELEALEERIKSKLSSAIARIKQFYAQSERWGGYNAEILRALGERMRLAEGLKEREPDEQEELACEMAEASYCTAQCRTLAGDAELIASEALSLEASIAAAEHHLTFVTARVESEREALARAEDLERELGLAVDANKRSVATLQERTKRSNFRGRTQMAPQRD
eukprot:g3830.t1